MGKAAIFWPNRMETATITGPSGGFLAAAPAANVGTDQPSETARTTDLSTGHTKIYADLGAVYNLCAFGFGRSNRSIDAQWRVLLSTVAIGGSEVLNTGFVDCWDYTSQLAAFEAIGVEDSTGELPDEPSIIVTSAYYPARYVTFELDDTTNPDGWWETGWAFAGGGLVPRVNDSWGRKLKRPALSSVGVSESGAQWPNQRPAPRGVSLLFEEVSNAERRIFDEMQRRQDICRNVLYVPDVDDMELTQREGFLGLLRELSDIEYPNFDASSIAVQINERG